MSTRLLVGTDTYGHGCRHRRWGRSSALVRVGSIAAVGSCVSVRQFTPRCRYRTDRDVVHCQLFPQQPTVPEVRLKPIAPNATSININSESLAADGPASAFTTPSPGESLSKAYPRRQS